MTFHTNLRQVHFCRRCGHAVEERVPDDGDTRPRAVCPECHTIHYINPLVVVGTVPYWEDKVLLCKRNIEPRLGKWTLPAGFMEMGESTQEGAIRETHEEAGAQIVLEPLLTLLSTRISTQVHIYYRAKLESTVFDIGHETQEARLFSATQIPWDDIAFTTVRTTLQHYFHCLAQGSFPVLDALV